MKQKFTLVLFILFSSLIESNTVTAQVNVQDSLALVDLYNSTNGAHWGVKWNLNMPVRTWYGITVNNGRVSQILLSLNALVGTIPTSLGSIENLNALDFSNNALSGSIPTSFGNLQNLRFLNLALNHLTAGITSLSNLVNLTYLNFAVNNLSGSVPASLGNLINLYYLSLGANQFSGKIPSSFSNLTNLTYLNLAANNLTGNIPSWLGNLINLNYLDLNSNQFSGKIPSSLSSLINLNYLSLAANNLTGNIPSWLNNLINLNSLYLDNNKLTGSIIHQCDSLINLYDLTFNNNQLTGTIPASFNNLIYLNQLNLSSNKFSGKVPSLETLTQLYELRFDNNKFTFAGMENVVTNFPIAVYSPQATIHLNKTGNKLSVSAGGTLNNNTYKWYKNGKLFKTVVGDSVLHVGTTGKYSAQVTNSVATALTLQSDTVNYTMGINMIPSTADVKRNANFVFVYPNPVKTTAIVLFNAEGKYTITITDISGRILQTISGISNKNGNEVQINIGNYASGIYNLSIADEFNNEQYFKLYKR